LVQLSPEHLKKSLNSTGVGTGGGFKYFVP
jgi:hypothetical protein